MKPIAIIGMGLSPDDLRARHLELIRHADILIGGKRHLDHFKDLNAQKKDITKNLKNIITFIKDKIENSPTDLSIVVLASGDPLYFGIGSLLIRSIGADMVNIYPNITSVAAVFAYIKEPWHDVHVISMHGRDQKTALLSALATKEKIALFTDTNNNPAMVAKLLIENNRSDFKICVLEQLGTSSEHIEWYELTNAAKKTFSEPNMVVLKRNPANIEAIDAEEKPYLGMPESSFDHQDGLITKAEVRAVAISKLHLLPDSILWDLGAGSGSVSIESSCFITTDVIFAVEQHEKRIIQIQNNKKRYNVNNLEIIHTKLPQGLDSLLRPDRIFIGGGGRDLEKIIKKASFYLKKNGIIVINTVLIQNIEAALQPLKEAGFKTDFIQIQVNNKKDMPWGERLESQNPVWIITGKHKEAVTCPKPTL
ncbi:MAG: precorrin-6y C5,15-methyltransferase (decarboxylating) subunit CbiE [Deltaproteobacteria bacterium]|nr:precorrin-6y C5,15-methyltransferase (decarboxylating) subunit CbiE [Deltaproteobacteria bacterium]